MNFNDPDQRDTLAATRTEKLRRLLDEVLQRRATGENLSDAELIAEHVDLMPELASELRKLSLISAARAMAVTQEAEAFAAAAQDTEQYRPSSSRTSRALHIRCPLCREPFEIAVDQPLEDLLCLACDGRFSLAGDDPKLKTQTITRIAHFELVERLGMGGFGTVWRATDTELGRTVALKIPRRGRMENTDIEEFLHEARVAAKLKHPNIVGVHAIGRDGDDVYIISDLVEGLSLARFNEEHRLTHRQTAELMVTICDALHFAHQAGVIHRDLKPGNVLLDAEGVPHITDFGLATRLTNEVAINAAGDILGTPAYMSPEQARGDTQVDRRTDVYSLGVMLFELLTDHLPFRGNVVMLTHHAVHTQPPSPRLLNASIPRDLETICLKCLQKNPQKRFSSAKELCEELRRFLRGDPILSRPVSAGERLWRWCKQNPRIPILSASLLATVMVVYLIAWVWFESIYARSDKTLTDQALGNVHFTAQSVARTAGDELERWYHQVEEAAADQRLTSTLAKIVHDEEWRKLSASLSDPATKEADAVNLRKRLEANAERLVVQEWAEELTIGKEQPVFAWFVQVGDGLQIARNPVVQGGEKTIGRNYAWRAYFHGGATDRDEKWRGSEHIETTQLSPAFVSQFTNEWVVVVSTPVRHENKFVGVLGLMLRLGSFAQLPGGEGVDQHASAMAQRYAVLVDTRPPNPGQILQHPLYHDLPNGSEKSRRQLLDRSQEAAMRVTPLDWNVHEHYRDPFAASDAHYDQRWLAARSPVEVRKQSTGLSVIVQESYHTTIGDGLRKLRQGLTLLSLATLGLAVAMVVPAWVMILRMVR